TGLPDALARRAAARIQFPRLLVWGTRPFVGAPGQAERSVEQNQLSYRAVTGSVRGSIPRNEYFAALLAVGCANGLGSRILDTIGWVGWTEAALSTFGTSVIVWAACYVGIRLILEEASEKVHAADIVVGLPLLIPMAFPIGGLSWLAVSVLSA